MDIKELYAVTEALTAFFLDHGITTMEEFESLDEEAGAELYEDLKAGILEVFDVDLDLIDELTDEILRTSQSLCKAPVWCRIEAPHRRNYK